MKSIHADLLTEQKKNTYQPALTLTLEDNGLPKPVALVAETPIEAGPAAAACAPGNAILRVKETGSGIETVTITDPTDTDQIRRIVEQAQALLSRGLLKEIRGA